MTFKEFLVKLSMRVVFKTDLLWWFYRKFVSPVLVRRLRKSEKVNVVFVLSGLATWKTESLFLAMCADDRFEPVIGVEPSVEIEGEHLEVIDYCKARGYKYVLLDTGKRIGEMFRTPIVLYQKPYVGLYHTLHCFVANLDCLFVYVGYAFHTILENWAINQPLFLVSSQFYFENKVCAESYYKLMRNKGRNIVVTVLPVMDELLVKKETLEDPWKKQDRVKKRIIWAPHHTIGENHLKGINYSTFLEYCDFMLQIAEKYKEQVQWAFKPHPRLIVELYRVWGKERTDAYYAKWATMDNTQFESGKYSGLFHYSDAMVHDCSSFTVEYHYTRNPVMYLINGNVEEHCSNLTLFAKEAFEMHYMGYSEKDIEDFVQNVINGVDPMCEERAAFFKECLLPPGGKSASENIIGSIKQMIS